MWVKICGNTNLEDAQRAAALGADAVGFIFARSPRQIAATHAARIVEQLPPGVETVAVFDSRVAGEIAEKALEARVHTVQLHGGFDLALLEELEDRLGSRARIIQALHWRVGAADAGRDEADALREQLDSLLARGGSGEIRVLVDSKTREASGGTGVPFAWEAACKVLGQAADNGLRVVAAGGLRPENVAEAIARLRPWGVDVSSGVELTVGQKDPARVAQFIARARGSNGLM